MGTHFKENIKYACIREVFVVFKPYGSVYCVVAYASFSSLLVPQEVVLEMQVQVVF